MALAKRYDPQASEPDLQERWQADGIYRFNSADTRPVFSVDTPPPTVSGHLHIGHVYSYSHADFLARYHRMRGENVFYPMGFDDNGLPTERFVEKTLNVTPQQIGRQAFVEKCLEISVEEEKIYRALWERLGLSVDWDCTYRTVDARSQRCSQTSFIDLYRRGLAYQAQAPMVWCPECRTAIAQAELDDSPRTGEFVTLPFASTRGGAGHLLVATTRPELLAACVAVFVHPADPRYQNRPGEQLIVPLYGQAVPVLADPNADPEKGTGAVMCCTFGDQTDVEWWQRHHLPLVEVIGADGRLLPAADLPGEAARLTGLRVEEARARIKAILDERGLILERQPVTGAIRVHERCDTPVEVLVTRQWFIRILENKAKFLELGEQVRWHPANMQSRYRAWVENLNWDWCISRQRAFGVPFPVWYCAACGEIMLAGAGQLPVDPARQQPDRACACGGTDFIPETDVMDTWATSSLTPQIVTGWLDDPQRFTRLFPMTVRPQAYEIIRTWAFSSIVKSWYHFGRLPWSDIFISGWAITARGEAKISKSRGGGPMPPMQMIERYSADALRYWAASTSPGKDALISEEKFEMGSKLITKLWNAARFAAPFITGEHLAHLPSHGPGSQTTADRWILAALAALVRRVTAAFDDYEYAQAKAEIETFFWRDLADNYIEMAKQRLYDPAHPAHAGACRALGITLRTLLKLLAPILPFVTDTLWGELVAGQAGCASVHKTGWPDAAEIEQEASLGHRPPGEGAEDILAFGELLISIASGARRYKSEHALSLGSEIPRLVIAARDPALAGALLAAEADLTSITRARVIEVRAGLDPALTRLPLEPGPVEAAIAW